jgi:hypothetical protein
MILHAVSCRKLRREGSFKVSGVGTGNADLILHHRLGKRSVCKGYLL